ncbi:MAG: tRNA uridine-5-carboxymethylaminomethyl(34) synthesis enzyme MnmG [Chthoniobacterales bacterium]
MWLYPQEFDVVVIGGGHAGIEAAAAASRLGCDTLLLTQNLDTIGQMSCNPAVGGLAKGHMVREIDALGGLMGENTDATGIQFRMLNANKGPSVRAPRAQSDKKAYQFRMKEVLESTPRLALLQGNVAKILVDGDGACGVETNLGLRLKAKSVVVTTGTFMRGLLHVGLQNVAGGRMGDAPSTLSDDLRALGFEVGRFKTGTPCRLNGRSIDFSQCERQDGDEPPPRFSYTEGEVRGGPPFTLNRGVDGMFHVEQIPCWITATTNKTHDIIRGNLDKSPMYSGKIEGVGPRYCPSIEDKVVRFAEKERHQLFLEPEGRQTHEYYVNGVSTSLPFEVQYAFIRTIPGLENAEIIRPGYAVEYDFCPPTQLRVTLETKSIPGLFFAGQINGTSGYEEAAAQGLIAGTNAALRLQGKKEFILGREEAYIGVLIDDLVTKGTQEPYRMFTSRAEYRLLLRQDNADLRLTRKGYDAGLISDERRKQVEAKQEQIDAAKREAASVRLDGQRLDQLLRRPEFDCYDIPVDLIARYGRQIWEQVETDAKYEGYIRRQEGAIAKAHRAESRFLPAELDYGQIAGLRAEARQKLLKIRPATLGQAGRISGITPADIALVTIFLEKQSGLNRSENVV